MKLGVIADDFTGATDIAGFLVENGLATLQLAGIPPAVDLSGIDAVVIRLRAAPVRRTKRYATRWRLSTGSRRAAARASIRSTAPPSTARRPAT